MKFFLILISLMIVATSAQASNLSTRGPLVLGWIKGLPAISSLRGDAGCEAISFSSDSDGIVELKLGEELSQNWLGIEGDVQINSTTLAQDYSGGGIDGPEYRVQIQLEKSKNQLTSVHYRYYKVSGVIFSHKELVKTFDCTTN